MVSMLIKDTSWSMSSNTDPKNPWLRNFLSGLQKTWNPCLTRLKSYLSGEGSDSRGKCPASCVKTGNGLHMGFLVNADILKGFDGLLNGEKFRGQFSCVIPRKIKTLAFRNPS